MKTRLFIMTFIIISLLLTNSVYSMSNEQNNNYFTYDRFKGLSNVIDSAYGNGELVCIGENEIRILKNGLLYNVYASGIETYNLSHITWDGRKFIITGSGYLDQKGTILTSADGYNWTPEEIGSDVKLDYYLGTDKQRIIVGKSAFYTSQQQSAWVDICKVFISTDNETWEHKYIKVDGFDEKDQTKSIENIVYNGEEYIAIIYINNSNDGKSANFICRSQDAINWTVIQMMPKQATGIQKNDEGYYILGNTFIMKSSDGLSWTQIDTHGLEDPFGFKLKTSCWINNKYFALYSEASSNNDNKDNSEFNRAAPTEWQEDYYLYTSYDGIEWTEEAKINNIKVTYIYPTDSTINISFDGKKYYIPLRTSILTFNGDILSNQSYSEVGRAINIKWAQNKFVVINDEFNIYSSYNGIDWRLEKKLTEFIIPYEFTNPHYISHKNFDFIKQINDTFYILGQNSTKQFVIYKSSDCINWSYVSAIPDINSSNSSGDWEDAVNNNETTTSDRISSITDFQYNGQEFICYAVMVNGVDVILLSNDLETWKYSNKINDFKTYTYNGKIYNAGFYELFSPQKNKYVFTGNYGFLADSNNLLDWTTHGSVRDLVSYSDVGPRNTGRPIWNGEEYVIPALGFPRVILTKDFKNFRAKDIQINTDQYQYVRFQDQYIQIESGLNKVVQSKNGIFFTIGKIKGEKDYFILQSKNLYDWTKLDYPSNIGSVNKKFSGLLSDIYCFTENDLYYIFASDSGSIHVIPKNPQTTEKAITVNLNKKTLEFDVNPVILNGRVLLPVREIAESLGAVVEYDAGTGTITITRGDTVLIISAKDVNYSANGENKVMDVSPQNINGRILVPVRVVSESFGADIKWDGNTRTVTITEQ